VASIALCVLTLFGILCDMQDDQNHRVAENQGNFCIQKTRNIKYIYIYIYISMRSDTCDMQDDQNDRMAENQEIFGIMKKKGKKEQNISMRSDTCDMQND